ncbi:MAG: HEAT repeat domain-containing protein, partial [Myxococcales bacterium]|nr:HEAT repeat domain-containing protein [Myxococcales bacterium]
MQRATRLMMFCAGLALLGATACETADPNSAAYWIEKLKGDNPKAAVRKLGEIDSPEATDALVAYYKEGRFRYDIVAALTRKGDHKAVPVLVEALQDTQEPKAAQLAASTLLEWKAGEGYTDTYVAVISNASAPNENRYGALQILAANPDPKATQPLLAILKSDPDIVPIVMIGLAAEALGKLGAEEAIPGLIRCLWLDDALGRNEVAACRLALNRVGPAKAVPKLIQTLERKNRTVEQRARKYKFDLGGIVEAKTAEMLGDMPDPSAVDPLIKALTTSDQMPPSIANDPKKAQVFVMSGVQKVISVA